MKVVIPGGAGFLGRALARSFLDSGADVVVLSRSGHAPVGRGVAWDGRTLGDWAREFDDADLVVNLAGRSVNCRYTPANREEILRSRVDSTRVLADAIAQTSSPIVWLNSSTATIYRSAKDHSQDEETGEIGSKEGKWGFSIQVATAWEEAFFERALPGVRRVALRSAMVMGRESGGPFEVMFKLAKRGLGGPMGPGSQMMSWVHEVDFIRAVQFLAARSDMDGVVNIVAPNALPNREFMAEIRRAAGVKVGLPAMDWMLRIGAFFMGTETELILKSRWAYPKRLLEAGFEFQFPTWPRAVNDLVALSR